MEKWKWVLLVILFCNTNGAAGQKKWDGEANDSLWNNPKNWFPDGLPLATDSVVIDNSLLQKDIFIWITDTAPILIHALTIEPSASHRVSLEIPVTNLQLPALSLSSKGNSISIHNNGILRNRSGASSGNSILLAGKLWIGNGGKYVHKTQRGNANLISALSVSDANTKGVFEFDVPGSAGYTISISGRQFGTLMLSSTLSPKKTYNGSGSSNMIVRGDLWVGDSVTLNSTLNGNILLHGNLDVWGKCTLNPSLPDSLSGRQIQFFGDSSRINIKGNLGLGDNFRNTVIERGKTQLQTTFSLQKISQYMIVRTGATLDIGDHQVKGLGKFKTEKNSTIRISGRLLLDDQDSSSSILLDGSTIDTKTNFFFYGDSIQYTGRSFPTAIGSLTIEKQKHGVFVSKLLEVTDTLVLTKGNLNCTEKDHIYFSGKYLKGDSSAFINGPIKLTLYEKTNVIVPLGDSSTFAPVVIHRTTTDSTPLHLQYTNGKAPQFDSTKLYPLVAISQKGYWTVQYMENTGTRAHLDTLLFYVAHLNPELLKGQPIMSIVDSVQKKWIGIPSAPVDSVGMFLKISPQHVKTGVYTMGELQIDALPKTEIELKWRRRNNRVEMVWSVLEDIRYEYYILQRSLDGSRYTKVDSVRSFRQTKEVTYSSIEIQDSIEKYVYRIMGKLTDGGFKFSNIVFVSPYIPTWKIFPNPTNDYLHISGMAEKIKAIHIIQSGLNTVHQIDWYQHTAKTMLNVSALKAGVYELKIISENGQYYRARFIKIN